MNTKFLFQAFYYLCLAFLVFLILIFFVSTLPVPGNYKIFAVLSGSMEPSIKMGSIVAVNPEKDHKIGDVITFGEISKTKVPVTHRITEIEIIQGQAYYTTKGDANAVADSKKISKTEVIGKVVFKVPYLGYFVNFLKTPAGFVLIIVLPAVLIIADEIKKIRRGLKQKRPEPPGPH